MKTRSTARHGAARVLPLLFILVLAVALVLSASACAPESFQPQTSPPPEPPLATEPPPPADTSSESTIYGFIHVGQNGELLSAISPLPEAHAKLAQDIIMNYMFKSAAFPGVDVSTLDSYYIIRQTLPETNETHDYYAYITRDYDIHPTVLQGTGERSTFSVIDGELYRQMAGIIADAEWAGLQENPQGKDAVQESVIAPRILTIAAAPAVSSDVQSYIDARSAEYAELVAYRNFTLRYCFSRFEQGGETGLEGGIMAAVCREILSIENVAEDGATGQAWYDAFKQAAQEKLAQVGEDALRAQYPGTWILIELLNA